MAYCHAVLVVVSSLTVAETIAITFHGGMARLSWPEYSWFGYRDGSIPVKRLPISVYRPGTYLVILLICPTPLLPKPNC